MIKGIAITGIEIAPEKFLIKKGKEKNLTFYDRRSRKIITNAIDGLDEHCCEFEEP
jgi:hypothetical protein